MQVSQARAKPRCSLLSLQQIAGVLEGRLPMESVAQDTLLIGEFSSGYKGESKNHHPTLRNLHTLVCGLVLLLSFDLAWQMSPAFNATIPLPMHVILLFLLLSYS